jgi:protein SCO1/2
VAAIALAASLAGAEAADPQLQGILKEVGIDQKLDEQVPSDLTFTDQDGRQVRIGDYFGKTPVILNLVYFECPMLCTQVTNGLVQSMRLLSLSAGSDYTVLTVSFDPRETAGLSMAKRNGYLKAYGREGADKGWHFLTGDEENIRRLADSVGFRYVWDAKLKQYAHAAAIMLLTPKGRVSKYFYGIEFQARDLRLGIVEATEGKIGTITDSVLLLCYHYDPQNGRYSMTVMGIMRLAGIATVIAIVGFMSVMLVREWRARRLAARRAG